MRTFLHGLFARLGSPTDGDPGDDQLLAAFVSSRDEAAFQQIVRRHGPMVHGVCRRVLGNDADADDAFQAVFLVLVRKANSVRPGNLLGNWLHGVAVNVARKGRELNARRRHHEAAAVTPVADARGSPQTAELREVIDQELGRLPADYRAAVVACDLEGRTRKEAASQLGWSEGTVASRLARARGILADRLTRRGLTLPAAGLAAALEAPSAAALPPVLLTGHAAAVETLATEAIRTMTTSKLKSVAVAALVVTAATGIGTGVVIACGGLEPNPPASAGKPSPDRSSEARAGGDASAAWAKFGAGTGGEKPGSGNAGAAKPARFVLRNPAGDITIISDRHEAFVEFFRRQRVMVAGIHEKDYAAALTAKTPGERVFVDQSSQNTSGMLNAVYGAYVRLAPVREDAAELVDGSGLKAVVLVADSADKEVWHVAGVTSRSSTAFFAAKEKKPRDDFAPADLLFEPKK